MRILLLTALLASVAAPAVAAPQHGHSDRESSADRSDRSDNSSSRSDRADRQRAERPQRSERAQPAQRAVRGERAQPTERAARVLNIQRERQAERAAPSRDSVANWRSSERRGDRDSVAGRTTRTRDVTTRNWTGQRTDAQRRRQTIREQQDYRRSPTTVQRYNDRDRTETRRGDRDRTRWTSRDRDHWRSQWRNDRRYDWRDYRNRNRSIFRLGVYFDPFGWNYQRYSIGFRLRPNYYSSNYWINDPYMYRLPYAPPGYRWIRYYNDAVLVDTWTGQVEDVIYNFFW